MCIPSKKRINKNIKRLKKKPRGCCSRPVNNDWGNDNIGFNRSKKNIIKRNGRIHPEPQNKSNG